MRRVLVTRLLCVCALAAMGAQLGAAAATAQDFFQLIRANDMAGLRKLIHSGADVNTADAHQTTPLLYAASFGNVDQMRLLLDAGASVNARNQQQATPLLLGVSDPAKVRLLIGKGADVNAAGNDGTTPLIVAAGLNGYTATIRYLLDHGADPEKASDFGTTPLLQAADAGNAEILELLAGKVKNMNPADKFGNTPLINAAGANCIECVRFLLAHGANPNAATTAGGKVRKGPIALVKVTVLMSAAPFGSVEMVDALLKAGANVNATDIRGMTALMLAVASEHQDAAVVKRMIAAGANLNVKDDMGDTALDWARKYRVPAVIAALEAAGATGREIPAAPVRSALNAPEEPRQAIEQATKLLDASAPKFFEESACFSCHSQGMSSRAEAALRESHLSSSDAQGHLVRDSLIVTRAFLPRYLVLDPPGGGTDTLGYILIGAAAARVPADATTDAMANVVAGKQRADGSWKLGGVSRAPIEESGISRTAYGIAALKNYGWPAREAEFEARIQRAKRWLLAAQPRTTYEYADRLLGLIWSGASEKQIQSAARELAALQRDDGGWAQRDTLASDAYATGLALYALHDSGHAKPTDAGYGRGVAFLLRTQLDDGSWYVRSRAPKFQPYFQSGFPHDHDQWISVAATAWAVMALAPAAEAQQVASSASSR